MESNESRLLREQLERIYSLNPDTQSSSSAQLGIRLQAMWRIFGTFMIHKPESQLQPTEDIPRSEYTRKVRLYPYLSAIEEERNWLEKIYHQANGTMN